MPWDTGIIEYEKKPAVVFWNGFKHHIRAPILLFLKKDSEFRHHSSSVRFSMRLAVGCLRGLSACTSVRIFLFSTPKKEKGKKRKTTTSGSVCESCMPLLLSVLVSLKPTWQDHPFLKRQAALQLWPGTASLIQRDCTTLLRAHVRGAARWPVGEEGQREGRHSASSSPLTVAVISGEKSVFLCVHKLLVNPADRLQAGDEWELWLLLHNTHRLTLKKIDIYLSEALWSAGFTASWSHRRPLGMSSLTVHNAIVLHS